MSTEAGEVPSLEARRMQVLAALESVRLAILLPTATLAYRANLQLELKTFMHALDALDAPVGHGETSE